MSYTNGLDKPTDYFNTVLYTGTGSSNAITGVGHSPDFVWTKRRNLSGVHFLQNTVTGTNKALFSDQNSAEFTGGVDGGTSVTSFDSDGFTVGTEGAINGSSDTFVSWNWKAGGTASSNTDGSITSSVSANTTAGFSIVSYTGTDSANTIGHSLSAVPNMIIVKDRDAANDWFVYHSGNTSAPETDYLKLNSTNATADNNTLWNDTAPTSSVFTIGTNGNINTTGNNYIAYCFAEKKGFSKFGSYTGNGNADGTFVYTGFKPAFVMIKRSSDGTDRWTILDNKRDNFNVSNTGIYADDSQAENSTTTEQGLDILSNGFKIRNSNTKTNTSGATYIYMCFSENPFVTSTGIPTTAR